MPTHSEDMRNFIVGMPKAELHVHLEGTVRPETVLRLANRNNMNYKFKTIADIQKALDSRQATLESFLDLHYLLISVIKTGRDFFDVTYDFLRTCKENNVVYVEMKFDPQFYIEKGITFDDMIKQIDDARKQGYRDFGVKANLIMCINRERTVESAWEMMDQAHPYRHLITGLGLDSYEKDNPPSKYTEVYETARKQGYRVTAHCDVNQENSIQHIWECLDLLKTDRIDHGINSIESPELVEELIKRDITLTTCPTWRSPYPGPRDVEQIRLMYDAGLKVTLNTDDPAENNSGFMNQTIIGATERSNYSKEDLVRLMTNAFDGSWMPREEKNRFIQDMKKYATTV